MKVTQSMLMRSLVDSMDKGLAGLQNLNEQLTTGKKVNTFSDDVLGSVQILRLSRENDSYASCLNNMQSVDGMLSVATTSLQQMSESLSNLNQLVLQAVTGTANDTSLQPISEAINNQLGQLLDFANVQYNGSYVFSGESVNTIPFQTTKDSAGQIQSVSYAGQSIATEVPIGPHTTSDMNIVGSSVFQAGGDIFKTVIALRDALAAGDKDKASQLLNDLKISSTDVQQAIVRFGERQNQLQFTQSATQQFVNLNTQRIADKQDADIADVTVKYNSQMAQLQMIMKVAAQAIPPSLIDFLGAG